MAQEPSNLTPKEAQRRAEIARGLESKDPLEQLLAKFPEFVDGAEAEEAQEMGLLQNLDVRAEFLSKQIDRIQKAYPDKFTADQDPTLLAARQELTAISQQQRKIITSVRESAVFIPEGIARIGDTDVPEEQLNRMLNDPAEVQRRLDQFMEEGDTQSVEDFIDFFGDQFINRTEQPTLQIRGEEVREFPGVPGEPTAPVPEAVPTELGAMDSLARTIKSFITGQSTAGDPQGQESARERVRRMASELTSGVRKTLFRS